MQKENYETRRVAETFLEALAAGNRNAFWDCLAIDVEWTNLTKAFDERIPWLGSARGFDQILDQFSVRDELIEVTEFVSRQLFVDGDRAVAHVNEFAKVRATGVEFEIVSLCWMDIRNGKIAKWTSYYDPSPIFAALHVNLSERLLAALRENDTETCLDLIQNYKADPNYRDPETGLTLLMLAACQHNKILVEALLDAGADLWVTDRDTGASVLHKACQGGSPEILRLLLEKGALIDLKSASTGHSPLIEAIWYVRPELTNLLVESRQNLYFDTNYGFSLDDHLAFLLKVNQGKSTGKKIEMIKEAIDIGRARDKAEIKEQKVMDAVKKGDLQAVENLIAAGADVNTVAPHTSSFFDGHTPLLVAARDGHVEIVRELLRAGADVRARDWTFKAEPIHKATYTGNLEILRMLVDHPDIDINVQGATNGYTPLHDALWHGYEACASLLIERGARLDLRGHDGKLPIDIAREVSGSSSAIVSSLESSMNLSRSEERMHASRPFYRKARDYRTSSSLEGSP